MWKGLSVRVPDRDAFEMGSRRADGFARSRISPPVHSMIVVGSGRVSLNCGNRPGVAGSAAIVESPRAGGGGRHLGEDQHCCRRNAIMRRVAGMQRELGTGSGRSTSMIMPDLNATRWAARFTSAPAARYHLAGFVMVARRCDSASDAQRRRGESAPARPRRRTGEARRDAQLARRRLIEARLGAPRACRARPPRAGTCGRRRAAVIGPSWPPAATVTTVCVPQGSR